MKPVLLPLKWIGIGIFTSTFLNLPSEIANAQVTADDTVNTKVTETGSVSEITGGETRGDNLFHSFQEFSVGTGETASFLNSNEIANIFSRVTGGKVSSIDGLIRANGSANLFLINPAGIIFGEGASLNIGGSFYGSSASSILFKDGEFSATDLESPPVLTINAPIGLGFRDNPQDIVNQSRVLDSTGQFFSGLQVSEGKNLALIGGDVRFDSGVITAPGGRVKLGGLNAAGTIGINDDGGFSFPDDVARGNVSLNNAFVDVSSNGGGSIRVNANNLKLTFGSFFGAGISGDSGSKDTQAGDIVIDAASSINLSQSSNFFNQVAENAVGNAGNIDINTNSLKLSDGSQITSGSFGQGNGGNVVIDATGTVAFQGQGQNSQGFPSGVVNNIAFTGIGDAGDVEINASNLKLTNGAQIAASTFGEGDAGTITINTSETINAPDQISQISIDGVGKNNFSSGIFSNVQPGAIGNANTITLNTSNLVLSNGGVVSSSTFGEGNAGNVKIEATDTVSLSGFLVSENSLLFQSQIATVVKLIPEEQATEVRQGGDISIKARNISLDNFALVSASTEGQGDAGNIFLDVDKSINLSNSGNIRSAVEQRGSGNAGNINVEASSVTLRGGSQILSSVFREGFNSPGGVGTGGNITITTTDFVDIAGVGNVQLNTIDTSGDPDNTTGLAPTKGFSSGLIANSERGASGDAANIIVTTDVFRIADGAVVDTLTANEGNGGNININANTFDATNGGQVLTTTRGSGNAGSINLNIADSISISGSDPNFESRLALANKFGSIQGGGNIVNNQGAESGVFANTEQNSTGNGGNISIGIFKQEGDALVFDNTQFTNNITISDGARIAADSQGEGKGGTISIWAKDLTLDNRAEILAETSFSQEGENTTPSEITLQIEDTVRLSNESLISAQADNNARGGNVSIDTNFIVAVPNQNNDILANAAEGTGGEINITAESVFGIEERKLNDLTNDINARSDVFGLDGTVNLNTSDINPLQGATELPSNVVEGRQTREQTCTVNRDTGTANGLIVTGRGGVQPSPDLPLSSQTIVDNGENAATKIAPVHTSQGDIIPAQGIIVTKDGRLILTAYPTNSNTRVPQGSVNCDRQRSF